VTSELTVEMRDFGDSELWGMETLETWNSGVSAALAFPYGAGAPLSASPDNCGVAESADAGGGSGDAEFGGALRDSAVREAGECVVVYRRQGECVVVYVRQGRCS